ncbi:glycosyltransferase [Pseudonocardia sp. T1-2H]|uniref:glycosyltransferase n=1 Tax=Pseudonocardia sp. T1-2H TaxID=3128899 RepID=UPI003100CBE9
MTRLEVLVPTRDRPVELATVLAGLASQDHPFDVLVSDQSDGAASFDTHAARAMIRVLEAAGRGVRTVRHLPRRGSAEHRASMLAASSADFVLFCDDDVWLEPGTVARLHDAILELRCGLVGAAMPGELWVAYKIAWIAGCVLYDRRALVEIGGFELWRDLPVGHAGEDVVAEQRVMERFGGAGILPSGAVHLKSPTTVPDRSVVADSVLGRPA